MIIAWSALWLFSWLKQAEPVCSPTSYYRNCWIRRFPGLYIAIEESQRRGAALLQLYQEESALKCSRACCLATNFSCNLAVYHYNTTQDSANCFHLHCPTLESCILRQRGNVILYNVTKGVDPDLLVFGKHYTSEFQVLPNDASSRLNNSEPFASDKRQFNRPHMVPSSSTYPATPATSTHTSTISLTSEVPTSTPPVSITNNIPPASSMQRSTLRSPTQPSATHVIANHSPHPTTTTSTKWASTAPQSSWQPLSVIYMPQKSLTLPSQPSSTTIAISTSAGQSTPSSTSLPTTTTWPSTTPCTTILQTAASTSQTTQASTTPPTISQTMVASPTAPTTSQTTVTSTTAPTTPQTTVTSTTAPTTPQTTWESTTELTNSQTEMASTNKQTTWAPTTESTTSHTTLTSFITPSSSTKLNSRPTITNPLISTQQKATDVTSAHSTLSTVQLNSTNATSLLTPLTTLKTTTAQLQATGSQATIAWLYPQPTNTSSSKPAAEDTTQFPTTAGNGTTTEHSTSSLSPTTSARPSSPPAASVTTSLTPPTSMEDSQPYPNDTKGYISRNITTGDSPRPGGDGGLTPVWHLAANTVLVALGTCATIAFGCCCSVLMAVSWRGRRRRKGRYRTTLRGKSGSMRLIKYVIVRESS